MTIHELKTHPEPFEAVRLWRKRFEMRSTADYSVPEGYCVMSLVVVG